METQTSHFIFHGISSYDYNLMICSFGSKGLQNRSGGSQRQFTTSFPALSSQWKEHGSRYTTPLEFTLQVCKRDLTRITREEESQIKRWLIRNDSMKWLQFCHPEHADLFYKCSATKIELLNFGVNYGMELTFLCDSPFAYSSIRTKTISFAQQTQLTLVNDSEEIGVLYPDMNISIHGNCQLSILNQAENRLFEMNNCTSREFIQIDGERKIITTSDQTHKIYNDFNWNYFRLLRSEHNVLNPLTLTGNAEITFRYRIIRKAGASW